MAVAWKDFLKRIFPSPSASAPAEQAERFFQHLHYRFHNDRLLQEALTHRSYIRVVDSQSVSNERLEYLGDSVLGLVVSEYLYKSYPAYAEGELTKTKALLVNEQTLSLVGKNSGLNRFILLSPDEEDAGGRERHSIVSDALEAVIGAIYLDGGIEEARRFIISTIIPHIGEVLNDSSQRNFKGELLEYLQARGRGTPYYEVVEESGPDHAKMFKVGVMTEGKMTGVGEGASKKEAEQRAAEVSLGVLTETDAKEPKESEENGTPPGLA